MKPWIAQSNYGKKIQLSFWLSLILTAISPPPVVDLNKVFQNPLGRIAMVTHWTTEIIIMCPTLCIKIPFSLQNAILIYLIFFHNPFPTSSRKLVFSNLTLLNLLICQGRLYSALFYFCNFVLKVMTFKLNVVKAVVNITSCKKSHVLAKTENENDLWTVNYIWTL